MEISRRVWKAAPPRSITLGDADVIFAISCTDAEMHHGRKFEMASIDAVLDHIDRDLDQSIERLFALLRIPSISTDPAYKDQCRTAAQHMAADLASIGFTSDIRPTPGHPVVVAKAGNGSGPRALFYGHYDVQPVD